MRKLWHLLLIVASSAMLLQCSPILQNPPKDAMS
jgi:hypothetical protein